jgi:hypothetical protein
MYILISATQSEVVINEAFHPTKEAAQEAMLADILLMTDYQDLQEIIDDANAGICGFSDEEAWADTKQCGIACWKIVKVPELL